MALRAARQRTMSDLDTTEALTAQDVVFRFEDAGPTETRSELVAAAQSVRAAIGGTGREFVDIWEIGDGTVVAILDVHHRRPEGREQTRLCLQRVSRQRRVLA
jgi:hypothetical protein